jgi:hypothetical protein
LRFAVDAVVDDPGVDIRETNAHALKPSSTARKINALKNWPAGKSLLPEWSR